MYVAAVTNKLLLLYNPAMPNNSYEIRLCDSCGLRYPILLGHAHGTRCPICMGSTRVILSRQLVREPEPDLTHPSGTLPKSDKQIQDVGIGEGRGGAAVLLDNVRSAWNVGSIFRSADGFGLDHAYLCGISPTPDGPAREAVRKTSLGAEDTVTWSYHKDAVKLVRGLKKEGWKVYALEEDERAIEINSASSALRSAQREILIVGNEVTGVDPELLDLCDAIYYIPMRGEKKSFNVAIAFGIAAYALR
jgi:23S rRNA (guanosine2251-2'-O)-methyltransferase